MCDKCLLPVPLDSRNFVETLCDSWVQTRGYEACVFCMPIPLRVCQTGVAQEVRGTSDLRGPEWNVEPRDAKRFYGITGKQKKCHQTFPTTIKH